VLSAGEGHKSAQRDGRARRQRHGRRHRRRRGARVGDGGEVFGIFPDGKYGKVGLARIAEMIGLVMGQAAAQEFIPRVAFTAMTGNGDMHLKNWSLLYPDEISSRPCRTFPRRRTTKSNRIAPALAGSDSDGLEYVGNEDLAVAELARLG
jgi:hypothetical protein